MVAWFHIAIAVRRRASGIHPFWKVVVVEIVLKTVLVIMYGLAAVMAILAVRRPTDPTAKATDDAAADSAAGRRPVKVTVVMSVFVWLVAVGVFFYWPADTPVGLAAKTYVLALLLVSWAVAVVVRGGRRPRRTGSKLPALGLLATSVVAVGCVLLAW